MRVCARRPRLRRKIDCEGQEVRALRGASGLLRSRRVRFIFIEIGDGAIEKRFLPPGHGPTTRWQHANTTLSTVIETLEQLVSWGYDLYIIVMCGVGIVSSKFMEPASESFWAPLAGWPRRAVDQGHFKHAPLDISCNPSFPNARNRSHWAAMGTPPRVELIRVADVAALVHGPMSMADWNLFIERTPLEPVH